MCMSMGLRMVRESTGDIGTNSMEIVTSHSCLSLGMLWKPHWVFIGIIDIGITSNNE